MKDFPDQVADENDAKKDPQRPEPVQRLPRHYERRYFMAAAIPSTRNTITRSQTRPMPNIMPIGMLDISIIMNCLPPRAQFDGTVTHFRPSSFAACITREDGRLGRLLEQRSHDMPHRLGVPRSAQFSYWIAPVCRSTLSRFTSELSTV